MATAYSYMTDQQLTQELQDYRAAQKSLATGGQLKVIAGEGRRKEFSPGDSAAIAAALREVITEVNSRPTLAGLASSGGGSLEIEFGHGGPRDDYGRGFYQGDLSYNGG